MYLGKFSAKMQPFCTALNVLDITTYMYYRETSKS